MSNYITTYSGLRINPFDPDANSIQIEDIAHALSLLCRGNGHVKTFYSVAQHCIACATEAKSRGYSDRLILACLLHDAGECYLSDIPRPAKQQLPRFKEMENRVLDVIYTKYLGSPLTEDEQEQLDLIDDSILAYDLVNLLGEQMSSLPDMMNPPSYEVLPFSKVEEDFLGMFYKYFNK